MLEQFLNKAIDAHRGTSFSPETRGQQFIKGYSEQLADDLQQIAAADSETKATYQQRYLKHLNAYLSAKSRIVSPMIAGPSNFPTRRMQKYNSWEDNAYKAFNEFREKAITGIKNRIERNKPEEQKTNEAWQRIEKDIRRSAATIVNIDAGIERGYNRALFVSSITGLIQRMAKNGQTENVKRAIELIKDLNSKHSKPVITERNSIFSLIQTAESAQETKTDNLNREPDIFNFPGGQVIINYSEDRVQIVHDTKPSKEELTALKAKGLNTFNFSFQNMAWQRKITRAAIWQAEQLTGIKINA